MKTKEEAYKHLIDTFDEFYSPKINESEEQYISLEEFEEKWIEIIREKYHKSNNESGC